MQTLQDLGVMVARHRKALGLRQRVVALQAGITASSLSRFERGRVNDFGSRKLLAVMRALGMDLSAVPNTPPAAEG